MAGSEGALKATTKDCEIRGERERASDFFSCILAAMTAPPALQEVFQKAATSLEEKDQIIATLRERIALRDEQIAGMVPKPDAMGGLFFGWPSARFATSSIKERGQDAAQVILEEIAERAWQAGHEKAKHSVTLGCGISIEIPEGAVGLRWTVDGVNWETMEVGPTVITKPAGIQVEMGPSEVAMFALGSIRAVERMVTVEGKALSNDAKAKLFQTLDAVQNLIHNPKVMGDLPIEPHGNRTGLDPASDKGAAPCR